MWNSLQRSCQHFPTHVRIHIHIQSLILYSHGALFVTHKHEFSSQTCSAKHRTLAVAVCLQGWSGLAFTWMKRTIQCVSNRWEVRQAVQPEKWKLKVTHTYTDRENRTTMQSWYSNISNTHCGNHYWILPYLILLWKIRRRLYVTSWPFTQRGSFTHKTLTTAHSAKRGATTSVDSTIKCHIHMVEINHMYLLSSRWSCVLNHTVQSLLTAHTNATHQSVILQATPRPITLHGLFIIRLLRILGHFFRCKPATIITHTFIIHIIFCSILNFVLDYHKHGL